MSAMDGIHIYIYMLESKSWTIRSVSSNVYTRVYCNVNLAYNTYALGQSFIHSGCFFSASSSPLLLRGTLDTARILCLSFTPKRHRQLRVKDLPKGPYVTDRAGFKPMTLRTKGDEMTNEPPCPTIQCVDIVKMMHAYHQLS